jgi:hypothetical protein
MSDKEVRADAKLKNLPADVLDTLWRLRNPEEDGEKLTLEAVLVELKNTQGIEVSISTLSEFYKWLRFKRRMESGRRITDQVMEQMRRDPSMTLDQMHAAAQFVFTNATMDEDDPKTYIALAKLRLDAEKVKNDQRRIRLLEDNAASAKAKLETLAKDNKGGLTAETLKVIEEAAGLL